MENYLVRETDICEIAAAAASLDVESVRSTIGDQRQWMVRAATQWKDWVKVCVTARFLSANCRCTYSRHSQINIGPYGGVVVKDLATLTAELEVASARSAPQFRKLLERTGRRVDRLYAIGRHDNVFKGEWYLSFLVEDVRRAAAGRSYNTNGLAARYISIANARLDFAQPWAEYFTTRLATIVQALQASS